MRFRLFAASDRGEFGPRPVNNRSAVTNDPLMLRGVDGRTVVARRYRDVAIALADDLGGQSELGEPTKILIRQAAALTVQVETLQSKIVAGKDVNLEQLTRLSGMCLAARFNGSASGSRDRSQRVRLPSISPGRSGAGAASRSYASRQHAPSA